MKRHKKSIFITAGLLMTAVAAFLIYSNRVIKISQYEIKNKELNKRIVQISDLHNFPCGKNNEYLINKIKKCEPEYIVMTGDILDSSHPEYEKVKILMTQLNDICPCIYIEGNHEAWLYGNRIDGYTEYLNRLKEIGIIYLRDEKYEVPNSNIVFYGLGYYEGKAILKEMDKNKYNIVLLHSPSWAEVISEKYSPNLILTGHTHGGQVKLPFIGGVFKHGLGKKAKYLEGKWDVNGSTLIVNTGLGSSQNHFIQMRVNLPPEIVKIEPQQN